MADFLSANKQALTRGTIAQDFRPIALTKLESECYHARMVKIQEPPTPETDRPSPQPKAVSTWSGQAREQAVQRMFTAIARCYDLNNTLLSFGLHHRWKRLTASYVPIVTNGRALDIGAGTADLALLIEPKMGNQGHVVASDLNHAMLAEGLRKVAGRGLSRRITCPI